MIRSTDLVDFDRLSVRYLEANTPWYLLRHYRASNGPEQLARKFTAEELVRHIDELWLAENRDATNAVLAYACTVALTYRPLPEVNQALTAGPLNSPSWFGYIIDFYRATASADHPPLEFTFASESVLVLPERKTATNSIYPSLEVRNLPKILVPEPSTTTTMSAKL